MHIIFDYEKDMKFRPSAGDGEITGLLSNDIDFNNFLIEWNEMRWDEKKALQRWDNRRVIWRLEGKLSRQSKKDYVPFEESNLKRFHNSMSVKVPPEIK